MPRYSILPKMLLTLDMYKEPLPSFNIDGLTHVRTHCGGLVSLIIILILFMFSVLKFDHLLSKHNPQVNTFVDKDVFDENDVWNADADDDFIMAFAVADFITGEVKDDPKFVKWFASFVI